MAMFCMREAMISGQPVVLTGGLVESIIAENRAYDPSNEPYVNRDVRATMGSVSTIF